MKEDNYDYLIYDLKNLNIYILFKKWNFTLTTVKFSKAHDKIKYSLWLLCRTSCVKWNVLAVVFIMHLKKEN